jgi:hypothetical protein
MSRKVGGRTHGQRIEREALEVVRSKEYTFDYPPAAKPAQSGEEKPFIGTPHTRSTRFERIDEVHPLFRPHLKPNPEDRS